MKPILPFAAFGIAQRQPSHICRASIVRVIDMKISILSMPAWSFNRNIVDCETGDIMPWRLEKSCFGNQFRGVLERALNLNTSCSTPCLYRTNLHKLHYTLYYVKTNSNLSQKVMLHKKSTIMKSRARRFTLLILTKFYLVFNPLNRSKQGSKGAFRNVFCVKPAKLSSSSLSAILFKLD